VKKKIYHVTDKSFTILATIFTLYMVYSTFRAQDIGFYQSMFLLGIVVLCGLMAIRKIAGNPELGEGFKFWSRLITAGVIFIGAVFSNAYLAINASRLDLVQPFISDLDVLVGWVLITSMILLSAYHWGATLSIIVGISTVYFFLGHHIPGAVGHAPLSVKFVMSYMGMNMTGGIFWLVSTAADKVYFLVLFASLLIGSGMMPLVMELGKLVGKHIRGGAAFPAIIGSGLTGSVMGQAVSNTMLTGQLTIPMMKKHGFDPALAGAIEATASSCGQFLPPILGLAAFIIASFLNILYIQVALAALVPAVLYMVGITFCILLATRIRGYGYLKVDIDMGAIYNLLPQFLFCFLIVLVLLLMYYSPGFAGLIGIGGIFVTMFFRKKRLRPNLRGFIEALKKGYEIVAILCLLLIIIGPIAQMATTTNVAGAMGVLITGILPNNLFSLLIACTVISLIIGMGLPTPVAYLMVALFLIPFLAEFGFTGLVAHFFIFYWAVKSALSPPVAVGALAASRISGAKFLPTAIESWKIIGPSCIIPFAFAYNPSLIEFPKISWAMLYWSFVVILLMAVLSVWVYGYFLRKLNFVERSLVAISGIAGFFYMCNHSKVGAFLFYSLCVVALILIKFGKSKEKESASASVTSIIQDGKGDL